MKQPPPRPRIPRRPIHGVLLLDKPRGLSSNDALQKVKRLYRAEKAGHTGTLDPLATGLLPICFGAATKFSQVSLDADKRYTATLQLGTTTTTGDAEGEVVQTRPVQLPDGSPITLEHIRTACQRFIGPIAQLPPMYSALKHQGRALYDYARAGIEIEREARVVTIHSIELLVDGSSSVGAPSGAMSASHSFAIAPEGAPTTPEQALTANRTGAAPLVGAPSGAISARHHASDTAPTCTLYIHCSKGTYVRTLAEDIGEALGCGAHLVALRRTGTGPLTLEQALTLEQLAALDDPARDAALHPADLLLADWPSIRLPAGEAARFLTGLRRRTPGRPDTPQLRVFGPEPAAFLGSAHIKAGELIPDRLLSPLEVVALCSATPTAPTALPCTADPPPSPAEDPPKSSARAPQDSVQAHSSGSMSAPHDPVGAPSGAIPTHSARQM